MSCQDPNDSLAFFGWTTEERLSREAIRLYCDRKYGGKSAVRKNILNSGDVSERRNIVRFYMRFTEKNKYRLFFVKKPV